MDDRRFSVSIEAGTIIKGIIFLLLAFLLFVLRDIVLIILAAIVISAAIDPAVSWFEKRKTPRAIGVIAIYAFLAMIVFLVFLLVIPTFLEETSNVVGNIPKYMQQVSDFVPILDQSILEGYVPLIQQVANEISSASAVSENFGLGTGGNIFETASIVASEALNLLFIIVLSFYFSVTKDGVEYFLRIITPTKHETYILSLWKRAKEKMGGWLQGQLLLAALVGSLIYPVLALLGVKHALLLAVLAGVLEIIPVFGPTLAAVPAVLLALLDGGVGLAFIVLCYYIIVQQFENNVFYPLVVKKIIGISPLIVMIALVIGAKLAGVLGMILAVPLSVILVEYIGDIDKRKASVRNS